MGLTYEVNLFVLTFFGLVLGALSKHGNQFPFHCYNIAQMCNFPLEYCSSTQKICLPCTRQECFREHGPPKQCQWNCTESGNFTPVNAEVSETGLSSIAISIIAVLGVAVVILVPGIIFLCDQNKKLRRKLFNSPEDSEADVAASEEMLLSQQNTNSNDDATQHFSDQRLKGVPVQDEGRGHPAKIACSI